MRVGGERGGLGCLPPKENFGLSPGLVWVCAVSESHDEANSGKYRGTVVRLVSECLASSDSCDRMPCVHTYHNPNVNTKTTSAFFRLLICNFQTACTGRNRIRKSVIKLNEPLVFSTVDRSTQWPGIEESAILTRGLHSKILTKVVDP